MTTTGNFYERRNARNVKELVCDGKYIEIKDLKLRDDIKGEHISWKYLSKDIPDYPTPVEFHITEVAHVTNKKCIEGILSSCGFLGLDEDSLSWWNLKISDEDITAAEERFIESFFPNSSKEEREAQQPFLRQFTTSPLFRESSRYGNFRFTYQLTELMEAYKEQICVDEEPVLRLYQTKLFKQEIEYVILVHSPKVNRWFKDLPELASSPLVAYDGKQIIWKAQAICETHNFQMAKHENNVVIEPMNSFEFYVWDQLSLAFHIESNKILAFPKRSLDQNPSVCEIDQIDLSNNGSFPSIAEAKEFLESLPEYESKKDEKEENLSGKIKVEDE
ncbi:uncharacterized protein LOC130417909 [Triplophysa dalaica]|uniref:uncharacterized protein LOC130417909 n=1 Tax=Triplophysa dalaica TaxID=1582913 RepID=UPI0024DF6481|nr:uncharacterized protein LOC130417909 [Triplophysa dalaica]